MDRELLEEMTQRLARRGPDALGLWLDESGGCGLGHRRLSIIDLAGGQQPLGDGQVMAVVNGEIYNHLELRAALEGAGHRFSTRSDSEVVVHGYREWGEGLLARLEGMFAFALWDAEERRLLLARDRMGKKPLYFTRIGEDFLFASEAKALFAHPEVSREVDPRALAQYLVYESVPEGLGLTRGLEKVLPGQYLVVEPDTGSVRAETYWQLRFRGSPAAARIAGLGPTALVELLRERVLRAVEARLMSDVPLGVLLSGGVDSSMVAAAMARLVPSGQVRTFSVAFSDPSFDESQHARRVARHLGTEHHEERLSPQTMLDLLPDVAQFLCEPIGDASVLPTYLLSRFTRREVKVALGGDGGDELFLGYPTFPADRVARVLDRVLPLSAQRQLGRLALSAARHLPVSTQNFSFDFKVKSFARGLGYSPDERHQAWLGSFLPSEVEQLLSPEIRAEAFAEHPYAPISRLHGASDARGPLDRATLQYARLYLAADVLVKVDRASMAAGLEVRAPLLDREVVELAAALPAKWKLRGFTTKYLLKEAARPWLPPGIVDRPKKGFGVPIGSWLRGPLSGLAQDLLNEDRLRRGGLFVPERVTRMLRAHLDGTADHRKPLWTVLAFELWRDQYGGAR